MEGQPLDSLTPEGKEEDRVYGAGDENVYIMASSGRSPKNLREIVASSQEDMDDMQIKLKKLKALSEDDKSVNALLRSRIDEQSQLIMILKQRADDGTIKIQTLERINAELTKFREEAEDLYRLELKKYAMLDARFNDLAENHSELIKFKDEYKRQNEMLRKENAKLKQDNEKLFSKALQEKDFHIAELEKKSSALKLQYINLQNVHSDLETQFAEKEKNYLHENKMLQQQLADSEERFKGLQFKLLQQSKSQDTLELETQKREQQLLKEKNEMLELAMQRGKIVQEKVTENKKLQQKIDDLTKSFRNMQLKFEQESTIVNANEAVRKLKQDMAESERKYSDVKKEFEAYKKHSKELLDKEKELNAKLRHLVG